MLTTPPQCGSGLGREQSRRTGAEFSRASPLTNGVRYTCTVSATNSGGTWDASTPLDKLVKPVSIAPLLGIILD